MVGGPDRPLPWCEGPKLAPFNFQGHDRSIIFRKHVGSAVHSHVFEVIIGGAAYALKMVSLPTNSVQQKLEIHGPQVQVP